MEYYNLLYFSFHNALVALSPLAAPSGAKRTTTTTKNQDPGSLRDLYEQSLYTTRVSWFIYVRIYLYLFIYLNIIIIDTRSINGRCPGPYGPALSRWKKKKNPDGWMNAIQSCDGGQHSLCALHFLIFVLLAIIWKALCSHFLSYSFFFKSKLMYSCLTRVLYMFIQIFLTSFHLFRLG